MFLDRAHSIPQASHTLRCVHPVVQLPISVTSSVPEMSAPRSPRGPVVQPSLGPNTPHLPLVAHYHNRREANCIIGVRLEYQADNRARCFRVVSDHGTFLQCVTPRPRMWVTFLMLISGKQVDVFLYLLIHSSDFLFCLSFCLPTPSQKVCAVISHSACMQCHDTFTCFMVGFDRTAVMKWEAIEAVTRALLKPCFDRDVSDGQISPRFYNLWE